MSKFPARQSVLNVTTIIDTEDVINNYPNPSTDPDDPTQIANNLAYMVATCGDVSSASGPHGLPIRAQPGDYVNWFGLSESNNFHNEIILYDVVFDHGATVFSTSNFIQLDVATMEPSVSYPDSAPTQQKVPMWYATAVVLKQGKGAYQLRFALYAPGESDTLELFGYFQWEPTIRVIQRAAALEAEE